MTKLLYTELTDKCSYC